MDDEKRDFFKETIQRYKPVVVHLKPFERWSRVLLVHEWPRTGDIMIQMFGLDRESTDPQVDSDDYSSICVSPEHIDDLIAALQEIKKRMTKPS